MGTMTLPISPLRGTDFDEVEDSMQLVKNGVKVVNRTGVVFRVIWKTTALWIAFSEAIDEQGKLIDKINEAPMQNARADMFMEMAGHIEHLVGLNDELLIVAAPRYRKFGPWMSMLAKLRVQRDTLESIAESFRCAADPEHQALIVAALETIYV